MSYEEMSDQEINFEVFHKSASGYWDRELSSKVWGLLADKYDYCNNPSDAWPIILKNQISITKYEHMDEWEVYGGDICVDYDHNIISESGRSCSHKNPLRAAMIVFLMTNEKD